jgi:integrase
MLVSNWAENYWAVSTVAKKTLYDYKNVFGRVVEPFIGHLDLDDVSLMDLQKMVLSTTPYQARLGLMIVKTLYREAKIYGMTEKNPTIGVKLPKRPEPKRTFLTWDQVNALDWGKYNDQVRFLALHGLRWSEAVALTEDDIVDGYVTVNKSFYGNTKSASSNRKVPYIGYFKPLPKTYKALAQAVNKHGITVHSLRRTYAYLLKQQGVHVTTAQKLLGHSDPMVTLKIYTSVLDNESDTVGTLLRNVAKSSTKRDQGS